MISRDSVIGLAAIIASLLLHGLVYFNSGSVAGNTAQQETRQAVTRVSFRSVAAPQTPPEPEQSVQEKFPEPEVTEAPEPPPRPTLQKPEKRAEKARQKAPESKPPERQTSATSVPTTTEVEKSPAVTEAATGTVADPALIEKARQEYLRRLMAHIEAHKEYPRAARRRRIEGNVRVGFSLQADGSVTGLQTEGGHSLLSSAARQAVERAAPMPKPPENLVLPWQVAFTMRFSLN